MDDLSMNEYLFFTEKMQKYDDLSEKIRDRLDQIWAKLSAEDRVRLTQQLVRTIAHEPHDFEHPDRVAERALCLKEGHLTVAELEYTQATHGTKHVCKRCGKFWHNEPLPPEKTNADP